MKLQSHKVRKLDLCDSEYTLDDLICIHALTTVLHKILVLILFSVHTKRACTLSPLGGQLQVPCCLQGQLETTKECQKQHKPPPHLSLNIEELQDLAHFEDQEMAAAALKWLNDTLS